MESVKRTQRTYRSPLREKATRRTREAVVEGAGEVFVEVGYAGATIEQIAARAGVSRPTVFGVGSKAQRKSSRRSARRGLTGLRPSGGPASSPSPPRPAAKMPPDAAKVIADLTGSHWPSREAPGR